MIVPQEVKIAEVGTRPQHDCLLVALRVDNPALARTRIRWDVLDIQVADRRCGNLGTMIQQTFRLWVVHLESRAWSAAFAGWHVQGSVKPWATVNKCHHHF